MGIVEAKSLALLDLQHVANVQPYIPNPNPRSLVTTCPCRPMPSSVYMPTPQRGTGHRDKGRISPLPSYSSAVHEKHGHRQLPWTTPVTLPIPGVRTRRLRILVPNFARFHQTSVARFGRKKGPAVLAFTVFAFVFSLFALAKRFGGEEKKWPTASFGSPSTLVFGREELQRIWNWEIQSGHYPSGQKSSCRFSVPLLLCLTVEILQFLSK